MHAAGAARGIVEQKLAGSIISVTSIEGVRAAPGYAAYAAAKAGVINATPRPRHSSNFAPHGILEVNALAPDITMTEGIDADRARGNAGRAVSAARSR